MSLGVLLAATSIYFAVKPAPTPAQARDNMFSAALIGSFYCLAALSAALYPGADWQDPDSKIQGGPQKWMFLEVIVGSWVAYFLHVRSGQRSKAS